MTLSSPSIGPSFPEAADRTNTLDFGRRDYLSTVWRLTRMELFKLAHRSYSRVVLGILLALLLIFVALLGISALMEVHTPASSLAPKQCSDEVTTQCTTAHYSQAHLVQMKQADLQSQANMLGFPDSFGFVIGLSSSGLIALIGLLLLGPIVGTEYGQSTIRLLFTRGPTRLQCMLAKALAGLLYIAAVLLLLALIYVVLGMLIYPLTGVPYSYTFAHLQAPDAGTQWINVFLLTIFSVGYWYALGVLAIFFGTLGRSTTVAVSCTFVWFIGESVLPYLLALLERIFPSGTPYAILKATPDYMFLRSFSVLFHNHQPMQAASDAPALSDQHALLVIGVYLVLLLGVSFLITMRRDVTN